MSNDLEFPHMPKEEMALVRAECREVGKLLSIPQVLAVKPSAVGRALDHARDRLLRMAK